MLKKGKLYIHKTYLDVGYCISNSTLNGNEVYYFSHIKDVEPNDWEWEALEEDVTELQIRHPYYGKYVYVRDSGKDEWIKRIFVDEYFEGVFVVDSYYEDEFKSGDLYSPICWKYWKPIPIEDIKTKVTLELTAEQLKKVNEILKED